MPTLSRREGRVVLLVLLVLLVVVAAYVVVYQFYVKGSSPAYKKTHERNFGFAVVAALVLAFVISCTTSRCVKRHAHCHCHPDGRVVYIFPADDFVYCECGGGFETVRWGMTAGDADGGDGGGDGDGGATRRRI